MPTEGPAAEEACTFMRVMTEADTWVAAAEASRAEREKSGQAYTGTFTANLEAQERIYEEVWEPTGFEALDEATQTIRDVQDVAFSTPPSAASAEIKKAWEAAVLRTMEGEQDAAASLAQAQEEAQAAWERASE
jgi:multiple sugar transport system substrate-binding protein